MAITIATDCFVSVNGVTLSDHASKVTLGDEREKKDITAFGATNRAYGKGLGDATMTIEFYQDFAASKVHATLQPLIGGTTPFTVEVRATSAARSATNPAYVLSALLFTYPMLDAEVGEPSKATYEFANASQTGVSYLTS